MKVKKNAKPVIPKKKSDSLSPVTSTTDEAGDENNLAPSLLIQESTDSQKMMNQTRMLESISPMNKDMPASASAFSTDTVKINVSMDTIEKDDDGNESEDSNDPLYVITPVADDEEEAKSHALSLNKSAISAVDELKNGPPKSTGLESPPPKAYQVKSLSLPSDPGDINADRSFEAMYEPAYRHGPVPFPKKNVLQKNDTPTTPISPTTPKSPKTPKDNTVNTPTADSKVSEIEESQEEPPLFKQVRDGDTDRNEIKQKILQKEEYKAKLKRKQSRTTTFDAKKTTKMNLWGRKMNEFPTKNGKQKIIEWRFIATDNNSHTLVLQHEQIKKKKKSKRMLILDGDEKYSDKSKKTEWKLKLPDCADKMQVNIENVDVNAMKYKYFLKINGMAYSAVFHKWSSQQQH